MVISLDFRDFVSVNIRNKLKCAQRSQLSFVCLAVMHKRTIRPTDFKFDAFNHIHTGSAVPGVESVGPTVVRNPCH